MGEKDSKALPRPSQEFYVNSYNINRVHNYLLSFLTGDKKIAYEQESKPYIAEYNQRESYSKGIGIGKKSSNKADEKTTKIVDSYLDMARIYDFNIKIYRAKVFKNVCPVCEFNMEGYACDEKGTRLCPECDVEHQDPNYNNSDIAFNLDNSNNSTYNLPNEYNDIENFTRALQSFQGKQCKERPTDLMSQLDIFFSKNNPILHSSSVKNFPYDIYGFKINTSVSLMCSALSKTGNENLYEDVYSIGRDYWEWKLTDLSKVEHLVIADYQKTQQHYNTIKVQRKRKISLCRQWRLFKHLQMRGILCCITMFKVMKMQDSKEEHEEMWKLMCEEAGKNDDAIFYIAS